MIKIFIKKFFFSFLTPKYNYQFHKKIYKVKNKSIKRFLNSFWFLPNSHEFHYWKYTAENIGHGFKQFTKMDDLSVLLIKTIAKYAKKNDKFKECKNEKLFSRVIFTEC